MRKKITPEMRIGWVLTVLAAFPFLLSCIMKFVAIPAVFQGMEHLGWPRQMVLTLGILEASSVVLYLIPQVAVLGAIVLTGFLGGAIATHLRIGEPVHLHVIIGIAIWAGLYLREPRLRDLLPVRLKNVTYEREITIHQPREAVFAYLRSLKNFQSWNPFLRKDPQARIEFRGVDGEIGSMSQWAGNKQLGAGEQEITRIIRDQRVDFELRFKKPFRARNYGYFTVESVDSGKTKVKWGMVTKPTFPMCFLMALFVDCDKMIGGEFDWGLNQLKSILEKK